MQTENARAIRAEERIRLYRERNAEATRWASGYGVIRHEVATQDRVFTMAELLAARGATGDGVPLFELLHALDRLTSAAMWLVVHLTYARAVHLDGRDLRAGDFKPNPEGHTGGSLNMVPAYAGYLAANAISGHTRAWLMGQGHCVAAIDTLNLLVDNMSAAHRERYSVTEEGLTRFVRDFYSYRLGADGRQESPLGSHVNAHTAGGLAEGGYLGFAELQYVHMPLPGERLVVFLSDGAFEEQRGSDWAPRWWRAEDCGYVTPIMIANGRRIDQRTTMSQQGGIAWFVDHLRLNGFDPIVFDGRDPAAFAWAILEMEWRLEAAARAVQSGKDRYPVPLPYGIAVAPKGAGFYGEGMNLAHNLPLGANPHTDAEAAERFNRHAGRLWVPPAELEAARRLFRRHAESGRPAERDHPLAGRQVALERVAELPLRPVPQKRRDRERWTRSSPMAGVDATFLAIVQANPHLRPRVGNPDEMRSNRMLATLDALRFRVTDPEAGIPEAIDGAVVTALNEEAVASAALANKGGINIIVTYEAFGTKMHGAVRQEIIFANHCREWGRPQEWLSIALVLTSHTWENAKNEQSHQDPAMAEAMLAEPSDVSRVVFVPDYNTACLVTQEVYRTRGQLWTLVVPKLDVIPELFSADEAQALVREGAVRLEWAEHEPASARIVLTAIGAYQLEQVLRAAERLTARGVPHLVVYMLEPGRFRQPRNERERARCVPEDVREDLYPQTAPVRVFLSHTRPEPMLGAVRPLDTGASTVALGYTNHGGTLDVAGMLFVNGCTWAHALDHVARLLGKPRDELLTAEEQAALDRRASLQSVLA